MDELLGEFLTETAENLEVVDAQLVRFEAHPNERAVLDNIFRLVHTIKGTCGFLALPRLEALAHAGETLLGRFRDGGLAVSPEAVTLVLQAIDRIKDLLSHLELLGVEPEGGDLDLIGALEGMSARVAAPAPPPPRPPPQPAPAPPERAPEIGLYDPELGRFLRPGEVSTAELEAAFQATEPEVSAPAPVALPEPPQTPLAEAEAAGPEASQAASVRVGVELLEGLMTSVSELVLTRNQLLQMVRGLGDNEFKAPLQRLSVITGELQEGVMKTRLQPVGAAWKKLPRIVRDIAQETGKSIELVTEGEAVELDRQVLELIKDPLTHMVRNSADHGLETPAERWALGKPETGRIMLSASQEGGCVVVRVADDGRGLNTPRIREKAVEKGLVGRAEAAGMSDAVLHRFIFAPGFSTAPEVTSLSGRGVGMDVVRVNIEQIGGRIEVRSVPGQGSAFTIKIPLTLAIVTALIVEAGGQRFAVPQVNVGELVRVGAGGSARVETLGGSRVLRLRERLLPLIRLCDHLRLGSRAEPALAMVMQVGGREFGVAIDAVADTEEIVVKPLAQILRNLAAFSGATILGDGAVVLILDPNALAAAAGELDAPAEPPAPEGPSLRSESAEKTAMLLLRAGDATPKAVPLALVTRIEDLPAHAIERSADGAVVQYRGKLMPLITVAPGQALAREGGQPVLVFADGDRLMGLAVDEVEDIVEEKLTIQLSTARAGVLGSAVLNGRSTEVLDVAAYLSRAFADWFHREPADRPAARRRVLLVDDSAFFRHMMAPLLSAAGYEVTPVASPEDAWRLHREGAEFDAIVSDIEMPDVDGFDFARRLMEESRWAEAPRIALTGLPVQQALSRAPEGAFREVVRKSDRQGLIESLEDAFGPGRAA